MFGSAGQDRRLGNADPTHFLHLSRSRPPRIQQHLPGQFSRSFLRRQVKAAGGDVRCPLGE